MTKKPVTVTLEPEFVDYLKQLAREYGISLSSLFQILLKQGAASLITHFNKEEHNG